MRFNSHWQVEGKHAFLGASKYHWIRYDLDKMRKIWENKFASEKGTRLHNLAAFAIRERVKLADNGTTLSMYVNDAIGFRMTPEQVLYYNEDCFGTADAISYDKSVLRVHDLKTGVHPGSFDQPKIYCALFCLEYNIRPYDIEMIMRIYQNDQVFEEIADPNEIHEIMRTIVEFTNEIEKMREVSL
jgi:hypothetical protein